MKVSRARGGGVRIRLEAVEARLLGELAGQVRELVADPPVPGADPLQTLLGIRDRQRPDDPVLARLLPDSHRDDPELAAELRRLGEGDLRRAKTAAAQRVLDDTAGGGAVSIVLDDEGAWLWLRGLTDIRLALGTRLGVTDDLAAALEGADAQTRDGLMIYAWLGELQERVVLAVDR